MHVYYVLSSPRECPHHRENWGGPMNRSSLLAQFVFGVTLPITCLVPILTLSASWRISLVSVVIGFLLSAVAGYKRCLDDGLSPGLCTLLGMMLIFTSLDVFSMKESLCVLGLAVSMFSLGLFVQNNHAERLPRPRGAVTNADPNRML